MSNLDGRVLEDFTQGINAPEGIEDAGKLVVVNAEGDNFEFVAVEEVVGAGGGLPGEAGPQGEQGPQGDPGPAGDGTAPGSYYGQPAMWDGSAWVPLAPGDALVLDRIQAAGELLFDPAAGARVNAPTITLDTSVYTAPCSIVMEGGSIALTADALGFFAATPVARPSITSNFDGASNYAIIDDLIAALVALGLVTDDR